VLCVWHCVCAEPSARQPSPESVCVCVCVRACVRACVSSEAACESGRDRTTLGPRGGLMAPLLCTGGGCCLQGHPAPALPACLQPPVLARTHPLPCCPPVLHCPAPHSHCVLTACDQG
jgi:hypothetical protein